MRPVPYMPCFTLNNNITVVEYGLTRKKKKEKKKDIM